MGLFSIHQVYFRFVVWCSNLKLDAECDAVQTEITECENNYEEVRQASATNNRKISSLKKKLIDTIQDESQLSSVAFELSQVLQEEVTILC